MMIAGVFQGSLGLMILYYGAQASTSPQTNETRLMIGVLSCTVRNKIKKNVSLFSLGKVQDGKISLPTTCNVY